MPWVSPQNIRTKEQYIKDCEDMYRTMPVQRESIQAMIDYAKSKPDDYVFVSGVTG